MHFINLFVELIFFGIAFPLDFFLWCWFRWLSSRHSWIFLHNLSCVRNIFPCFYNLNRLSETTVYCLTYILSLTFQIYFLNKIWQKFPDTVENIKHETYLNNNKISYNFLVLIKLIVSLKDNNSFSIKFQYLQN